MADDKKQTFISNAKDEAKRGLYKKSIKDLMDSPTDANIVKADELNERYMNRYKGRPSVKPLMSEPGEPDYAGVKNARAARKAVMQTETFKRYEPLKKMKLQREFEPMRPITRKPSRKTGR